MIILNHNDFNVNIHLMTKRFMHYDIHNDYLKLRFIMISERVHPSSDHAYKLYA